MKIYPGTRIKWKSTAYRIQNGFCNKREGVYMGYCQSGTKPNAACPELVNESSFSKKFGYPGSTSENDRVIVKVPRFHSTTKRPIAPHYFGPRVSAVTHAYLEGQWIEIVPKQVEWINASNHR